MIKGQFCFLNDDYYIDFPDKNIMKNKESIDGNVHDRPCFFAFCDKNNDDIYWLVPASSKIEKYKSIYNAKVKKYGKCNTIVFGRFLNKENAFLIQNMCPVTQKYIKNIYVDKNNKPIYINYQTAKEIIKYSNEVLAKQKYGVKIIFPDVLHIKNKLLEQLENNYSYKVVSKNELENLKKSNLRFSAKTNQNKIIIKYDKNDDNKIKSLIQEKEKVLLK